MLVFFFFLVMIFFINIMVYIMLVIGFFGFCGVRKKCYIFDIGFLKKFVEILLCKLVLLLLFFFFEGFL